MHYILGLDIGITSIGWAVIESDQDGVPFKIADLEFEFDMEQQNGEN